VSTSRWARSRRRGLAAVAGAGLVAATLSTTGAAAAPPPDVAGAVPQTAQAAPAFEDGSYLVVMKDEPVVAYDGGVEGYERTKPQRGDKYAPRSQKAQSYRAFLKDKQDEALEKAGNPRTLYRYTEAVSGFAADLTGRQATALAKDPAVLAVTPDELRQLDTVASPEFLGLTGAKGVWSQLGGQQQPAGAGAGVVVGIIDTGIWPENPSFAGDGFTVPEDWNGQCVRGPQFDPNKLCNGKLIGARYFVDGFGAKNIAKYEWLSPRDADGHGTHTASTAAGNDGVTATIEGRSFGTVSGMAPEAHVAAYKVCWDGADGGGGCQSSDSAAAIDQAVMDGVDVLNFSISGTSSNYLDAVELAFMYASDAGVFVAASSGNDGPTASTTNHPSPWLTTVAASTHTIREKTLVTGDGQRFIGASITEPLPAQTPMVLAEKVSAAGAAAGQAALCGPGTLDAAAAGKLVVCDRGVYDRVAKSAEVARVGGTGMVLVNVTPGSLDTDLHSVPTVHLPNTVRDQVRAYATGGGTGAIQDTNAGSTTQVPEVAGFSSRGPSLGAGGDILKPDVSAPGVGVLAAYSPRSAGRSFDFLSGTSMSSPHIAGLGALFKDAHPDWSPMAIKSAMMTTARDHASAASNDVFAGGAGFVEPRRFLSPGLVYDADQADWWDFLAGQGVRYSNGDPVSENPVDASDLNQASIAVGALAGQQTITRTVTNVSSSKATWKPSVTGVAGVSVEVSPQRLELAPGESKSFTVTFTRTDAAFGAWAKGFLTWTPGGRNGTAVRSPIAVRPVGAAAPAEVSPAAGDGSVEIPVTSGFTGTMSASVKGLVAGTVTRGTAQNTAGADFGPTDVRNYRQQLVVPAGTTLTRVELRAASQADDLDLFVTDAAGKTVASSATGAADERITTSSLAPGTYTVHVQAWAVDGGAASTQFDVREFLLGDGAAGNLAVSPASTSVSVAQRVTFTGTLSGLQTGRPYLGMVDFADGSTRVARTVVSVG
jgi:subtilisin family serine protease